MWKSGTGRRTSAYSDEAQEMSIALTVCELRQEQGLSQPQLAARAGVTLEALRNVESGNKAWPRTIERIARALGLTPMQLYERAAAMRHRRVPATPPPVGATEEWCNACSRTDPRAGADPIHRKTILDQHRCSRDDPRLRQPVRAELHGGKPRARGDASFWLRLDRRLRAADHLPDADNKRSRGD
jgi:DNA-binding transcriptional regulator YiaG